MGIANVPKRIQVYQLTTGDLNIHRGRAAGRDHRGDVAGGAVWINLGWAIALRRTADDPVLSSGSNWLSVNAGNLRVRRRQSERRVGTDSRQQRQDIVGARVHESAVTSSAAVREWLAAHDWAEEVVVIADILERSQDFGQLSIICNQVKEMGIEGGLM